MPIAHLSYDYLILLDQIIIRFSFLLNGH